jgi:hydrogenase nickel incorporation protein HypA/HybF
VDARSCRALEAWALAGVVKGALLSSYKMACEATALQGSRLVIEEIPVEIFCAKCDARRPIRSIQWFAARSAGGHI